MKFNWGTGIFLFYTTFAVMMIGAVIKSTQFDNSLVMDDYYAKDITYQETIDRKRNSLALEQAVVLHHLEQHIAVLFPKQELSNKPVKGQVHFYRPSSSQFDTFLPLKVDTDGRMLIPLDGLLPGYWNIIIEWSAGDQLFRDDFELTIAK